MSTPDPDDLITLLRLAAAVPGQPEPDLRGIELQPEPPRVVRPLFEGVEFKAGPVPELAHPGELVIGIGAADAGLSEVVVAFSDPSGFYVLDRGRFTVDGWREVVLKAKLPERPAPAFRTFAGLVSLVDPPDPAKLTAKAAAAGISMDRIDSALWLALDAAEDAQKRERAARDAQSKAVRSRDKTGTKLGEARKAIYLLTRALEEARAFAEPLSLWQSWAKSATGLRGAADPDLRVELAKLVRVASASTTWVREQVADIDPDLPVAEFDEAQLRGVVGVELLRLRRELEVARAESEANNARIGEVVAERAALRRDLEGQTDMGKELEAKLMVTKQRASVLEDLARAYGAPIPKFGPDLAPGPGPSIEAQREALVAANPPPRSPFTPEQERAIGSLLPKVSVLALEPGRWQVYVDGEPWAGLVVQQPDEESAKRLGCIALARMRRPGLWPNGVIAEYGEHLGVPLPVKQERWATAEGSEPRVALVDTNAPPLVVEQVVAGRARPR